ncbi:unnamed protein product, partial [Didymodactylos carnosus]
MERIVGTKTTKKTPFEMVFGQQSRSDEDFWKRIQQQMKENDDNNSAIPDIEKGIMLEEKLPLEAATLFDEFDKTVSQSDDDNDDLYPMYDRHKKIREEGEKSYLSIAQSQLLKYITNSTKRQRTYVIGDIIGSNISDVARTNISSTVSPCKVVR